MRVVGSVGQSRPGPGVSLAGMASPEASTGVDSARRDGGPMARIRSIHPDICRQRPGRHGRCHDRAMLGKFEAPPQRGTAHHTSCLAELGFTSHQSADNRQIQWWRGPPGKSWPSASTLPTLLIARPCRCSNRRVRCSMGPVEREAPQTPWVDRSDGPIAGLCDTT